MHKSTPCRRVSLHMSDVSERDRGAPRPDRLTGPSVGLLLHVVTESRPSVLPGCAPPSSIWAQYLPEYCLLATCQLPCNVPVASLQFTTLNVTHRTQNVASTLQYPNAPQGPLLPAPIAHPASRDRLLYPRQPLAAHAQTSSRSRTPPSKFLHAHSGPITDSQSRLPTTRPPLQLCNRSNVCPEAGDRRGRHPSPGL